MMMTAGAGWVGRIVAAVAQIGAIRILTGLLGVDGYGAFAVISGLLAWFMLADLGFGPALQNYISGQRVADKPVGTAIWTVCLVLLAAMVALSLLWLAVAAWAGPALVGRYDTVGHREAVLAFFAFAVVATGAGVSAVAMRVAFAEHRGYLAHAMTASASVLGVLGLLIFAPWFGENKLVWALFCYFLPGWLIPMYFLARKLVKLWETGEIAGLGVNREVLSLLFPEARKFLILYALAALVNNVDFIILSQTVSADEVAVYAVFSKIFVLAFTIVNSVIGAYWPVSAEMVHRRDLSGINRVILVCFSIGASAIFLMGAMLLVTRHYIADILAPSADLALPATLIAFFVVYWIVRVWSDTFAMLVVSASKAHILSFIAAPQALMSVALGYWGAKSYGVSGLMVGMTCAFLLTTGWALPWYMHRFRQQLHQEAT
ncbi:lipopolysaccharide biosynthesis protein [Sphingomonas qomolangmaensis]|uniref:MATE family efflux transporter n=1 Tax=Sphingomonas qomolangmaensis TaxID=2918765 RepID=A0ABY5L8Y2_9SPHN|nr:MATE family efflux transporter [Sphingomonas qomolangmaensis]UUL82169.1 MATE family efflux transporter [Sphingomonas qomolangmaensis]